VKRVAVTVQRLLVIIAFGVLALIGAGGEPQRPLATADRGATPRDVMLVASSAGTDGEYLDLLTAAGIKTDDPARLIDNGRALCVILDGHSSKGELVVAAMALKNGFGLSDEQATKMIDAAIGVYCPNHEDVIR
jgi:hypothetical protein